VTVPTAQTWFQHKNDSIAQIEVPKIQESNLKDNAIILSIGKNECKVVLSILLMALTIKMSYFFRYVISGFYNHRLPGKKGGWGLTFFRPHII